MKCKNETKILAYLLDELDKTKHQKLEAHLQTCEHCQAVYQKLKETHDQIQVRLVPAPPHHLVKKCIQTIRVKTKHHSHSHLWNLFSVFERNPKPLLRWALLIVVFGTGLGLGKIIFDTPQWSKSPGRWISNSFVGGRQNRSSLRQYLLSVETLLLDISNVQYSELEENNWDIEMEITQKILQQTVQIKTQIQDNPDLLQLVTDIEWVLEDMLDSMDYEMAGMPETVRQTIQEQRLLSRLYVFMS